MTTYTKIQTDITDLLFVFEGLVISTSNYSFDSHLNIEMNEDFAHNFVNCAEMSM